MGAVGDIMRRDLPTLSLDGADEPTSVSAASLNLSPDERTVFGAVASGTDDADQIAESTGLDIARIATAATSLQLKGLLTRLPGDRLAHRNPPRKP